MTIASMRELLSHALRSGYAIGYYESWDQYSLEGAMEAAEATSSPAIIGFGGAVTNPDWLDRGGVEDMSRLARRLAERSRVPTAVLFNEAQNLSQIRCALDAGCNAVMLESGNVTFQENVALTCQVVAMAHAVGATVEAELGHLSNAIDPQNHAVLTSPEEAARFVALTGVDVLAVSIGNAHLVQSGEAPVDLERLSRIHSAVSVPLALHGGTGFPRAAVREAIAQGVAKFNIGTRLKRLYLAGMREAMPDPMQVPNIHPFVGSRNMNDILVRGKERMKAEIVELMRLYGSAGQAAFKGG